MWNGSWYWMAVAPIIKAFGLWPPERKLGEEYSNNITTVHIDLKPQIIPGKRSYIWLYGGHLFFLKKVLSLLGKRWRQLTYYLQTVCHFFHSPVIGLVLPNNDRNVGLCVKHAFNLLPLNIKWTLHLISRGYLWFDAIKASNCRVIWVARYFKMEYQKLDNVLDYSEFQSLGKKWKLLFPQYDKIYNPYMKNDNLNSHTASYDMAFSVWRNWFFYGRF